MCRKQTQRLSINLFITVRSFFFKNLIKKKKIIKTPQNNIFCSMSISFISNHNYICRYFKFCLPNKFWNLWKRNDSKQIIDKRKKEGPQAIGNTFHFIHMEQEQRLKFTSPIKHFNLLTSGFLSYFLCLLLKMRSEKIKIIKIELVAYLRQNVETTRRTNVLIR